VINPTRLTHQNFRQLDEYCFRTPSAKIGVLTNGIVYQFFTKTQTNALEVNPFFTFNLKEHSGGDIEMLALFQRQLIDTKIITERASEIYFFDRFDDALYESLKMPNNIKELTPSNKSFLEIIFRNMGGKRFTDSALEQIHPLVNAISLKSALDRVIKEENINSNTGIITTSEEIKFYNIVKTILGLSPKTKKQLDRVGYRDFKNFFGIVLDDNQRKGICYLRIDKTKKTISFSSDPNSYEIKNISVEEITKYKSQIIQSFLKNLD
jgi:hypothetical protein